MYALTMAPSQFPNIPSNEVFPRLTSIHGSLEFQGITTRTREMLLMQWLGSGRLEPEDADDSDMRNSLPP